MTFLRADLFSRLLVLVVVATAPAVVVLAFLQSQLHDDDHARLAQEALRQAELVNGELAGVVEGARQLTLAVSRFDGVRRLDPSCAAPLAELRGVLGSYETLAIVAEDGLVVCSAGLKAEQPSLVQLRPQIDSALQAGHFDVGVYAPAGDGHGAILPFYRPFTSADGQRRGVVVAGLSLPWLSGHLAAFPRPALSIIAIGDREGRTLALLPEEPDAVGKMMPPATLKLVNATTRGNAVITGTDGLDRLVGFVPVSETPQGLFASMSLNLAALTARIDHTSLQGDALMAIGTLLSLWLAMLVGERFVRRPTAALLDAARRWSQGDLAARVEVRQDGRSEFGSLARAFNSMAAALGRQRTELEELNTHLEARVADRTADLRVSRDQLQVAMAEHAKSEASLRQAQKMQAVGQLAGGIAHDFNNLLTAVVGALELLRRRLPADDARSLRLADHALMAADRGGRLTAQLLSFSRRQRLLPVPTDLNQVVEGMLGLMASTLGRTIHIETSLCPELWTALIDPHQVESAILNLAINARDAMAGGGVLRITTANVTRTVEGGKLDATPPCALSGDSAGSEAMVGSERAAPGDYVLIAVSDTGTGMTPDVLSRVFEPFFTTKQPGQGSGLGLSQVHGLASQSGGEIWIESVAGRGSTVSLLLPRAFSPVLTEDTARRGGSARQHSLVVLVVDDDADVRRMTGEMLSELGHTPLLAPHGVAALAMLVQQGGVDVLMADYAMPGLSGTQLIDSVLRSWPELRVVLVTGHADTDASDLLGGHVVLRKPFTMIGLARLLEDLVPQEAPLVTGD